MNILIAPNAFKNSLDASDVAAAIALGFKESRLKCNCQQFPVGDGGDGTANLIIDHFNGEVVNVTVHDALERLIEATFGLIDKGKTAVIEMADAAGLKLLKKYELNPLQANSFGTGEMILAALDRGVDKIIIGMGGSGTVDGGIGILNALGVKFLNEAGYPVSAPCGLNRLASIDLTGLDERILNCEVIILCDVDNKLLGNEGAAAVFGPQKGATPKDIELLDEALEMLSVITLKQTGKNMATAKHGGTAGGAAAGLYALLNAKLVSGATYFLNITGFDEALQIADLVITGEGRMDEQTLQGKAPFAVAYAARQKNIPVIGLAGNVPLERSKLLSRYFDILLPISNQPESLADAIGNTSINLTRTATELGNLLALKG